MTIIIFTLTWIDNKADKLPLQTPFMEKQTRYYIINFTTDSNNKSNNKRPYRIQTFTCFTSTKQATCSPSVAVNNNSQVRTYSYSGYFRVCGNILPVSNYCKLCLIDFELYYFVIKLKIE